MNEDESPFELCAGAGHCRELSRGEMLSRQAGREQGDVGRQNEPVILRSVTRILRRKKKPTGPAFADKAGFGGRPGQQGGG